MSRVLLCTLVLFAVANAANLRSSSHKSECNCCKISKPAWECAHKARNFKDFTTDCPAALKSVVFRDLTAIADNKGVTKHEKENDIKKALQWLLRNSCFDNDSDKNYEKNCLGCVEPARVVEPVVKPAVQTKTEADVPVVKPAVPTKTEADVPVVKPAWGKLDQDAKKPAIVAGISNDEKNFPSLSGSKLPAAKTGADVPVVKQVVPTKTEAEVPVEKPAWGKLDQDAKKPAIVAGISNDEKNFPSLGGSKLPAAKTEADVPVAKQVVQTGDSSAKVPVVKQAVQIDDAAKNCGEENTCETIKKGIESQQKVEGGTRLTSANFLGEIVDNLNIKGLSCKKSVMVLKANLIKNLDVKVFSTTLDQWCERHSKKQSPAQDKAGDKAPCVRDGGDNASKAQKDAYWNCIEAKNKMEESAKEKALRKARLEDVKGGERDVQALKAKFNNVGVNDATTAALATTKPTNSQFKNCKTDEHCGAFCAPWPVLGGTPKNGCQPRDVKSNEPVTSGADQNNNHFKYCAKQCTADKCGK